MKFCRIRKLLEIAMLFLVGVSLTCIHTAFAANGTPNFELQDGSPATSDPGTPLCYRQYSNADTQSCKQSNTSGYRPLDWGSICITSTELYTGDFTNPVKNLSNCYTEITQRTVDCQEYCTTKGFKAGSCKETPKYCKTSGRSAGACVCDGKVMPADQNFVQTDPYCGCPIFPSKSIIKYKDQEYEQEVIVLIDGCKGKKPDEDTDGECKKATCSYMVTATDSKTGEVFEDEQETETNCSVLTERLRIID